MQASNAAMVSGRPSRFTPKRLPLKICGTRQQSASVGVSPQQYTEGASPCACRSAASSASWRSKASRPWRTQWWYQAFFASSSACRVPVRYLSTRGLFSGWISQATICARARTRARARGVVGNSAGVGCSSSRYSMMAMDCGSTAPSSVTRAGTRASPTRLA